MNRALAAAAAAFGVCVLAFMVFGPAAMAQTASPTPTGTPRAGATTTSVVTATHAVTGTTTSTPAGQPTFVPTIVVPSTIYKPGGGDFPFAHPAFERVWDRTDSLVKLGQVSRTWFWGPGPN